MMPVLGNVRNGSKADLAQGMLSRQLSAKNSWGDDCHGKDSRRQRWVKRVCSWHWHDFRRWANRALGL